MGRGDLGSDRRRAGLRSGASRVGRAERACQHAQAASTVLVGVRRLREEGVLGGREFDLWLVALRAGPCTPKQAATRLGVTPELLRPRISRWMRSAGTSTLVYRNANGQYGLLGPGANRADTFTRDLRRAFVAVAQDTRRG